MTDMAGRLDAALAGRYRIERELGQGGMATVYLAQDLKHDRRVALKVLRPDLAAILGPERFLKEIRLTANLQHPHILPLLDSGQVEGTWLVEGQRSKVEGESPRTAIPPYRHTALFYVMPFVEGESLRDRLSREHQLGIDEAVRIATEVADALSYAHGQGVIHRDIKPENILLYGGHALVADFGIALAASRSEGAARITETGISLGTPAYMAPEQAMGERDLTPRADIYSLSCVLYEMLAGDPPFQGGSAQAIVAKVLTERAPLVSAGRETVPRHIAAAVHKGLARLPADRFPTAAAFADALARPGLSSGPDTIPLQPGEMSSAGFLRRYAAVLGLSAALVLLLAFVLGSRSRRPPPGPLLRIPVALPEGQGIALGAGPAVALAPDASRLVYLGATPNGVQLRLWSLNSLATDSIPGTAGAAGPVFSPDGRSLAFWQDGVLKSLSLQGGLGVEVADSATILGDDWGPDGYIYYARAGDRPGISRVRATGGPPEIVSTADTSRGETDHRWVSVLPNGRGVLFTAWRGNYDRSDIEIADFGNGRTRVLTKGIFARVAPTGYLIVIKGDHSLWAAPFDLGALKLSGREVPLLKGVNVKNGGASDLSLARSGTLAYVTGETPVEELVWVARDGSEQAIDPALRGNFGSVALSPDGSRIALSNWAESSENLWIYDVARRALSRLTFDGVRNRRPEWSLDGASITYSSDRAGELTLWRVSADGGAPVPVLPASVHDQAQEATWTPDGALLVFRRGPGGGGSPDLMVFRPGRDSLARPLLTSRFSEFAPHLSPDGRWLAYVSNESGRREVYVRSFPETGGKWQVSTDGGAEPVWSRSGEELFYRSADGELMSASVRQQPSFAVLSRRALFSASGYATDEGHALYGVTPDAQHFLMVKVLKGTPGEPDLGARAYQLVLVLNWFQDLTRAESRR